MIYLDPITVARFSNSPRVSRVQAGLCYSKIESRLSRQEFQGRNVWSHARVINYYRYLGPTYARINVIIQDLTQNSDRPE